MKEALRKEQRNFAKEIEAIANPNDAKVFVFENSDLYQFHKFLKRNPVHLLIGKVNISLRLRRYHCLELDFQFAIVSDITENPCLDTAVL